MWHNDNKDLEVMFSYYNIFIYGLQYFTLFVIISYNIKINE
jgi:hypothetical protein